MARPKKIFGKEAKILKAQLLKEIEKNMGILSVSLKKMRISRYYYDLWMSDDPEFNKDVEAVKEITLDFVESKLLKKVEEGDMTGIIFYLKCKGKNRGFIEKQYIEQETTFVAPLKINVVVPTEKFIIDIEEQKKLN
jgi:hypothetical protein